MAQTGTQLRVSPDGSVMIPATLAQRLGWKPGDTLQASVQGGSLVLERRETALARLRGSRSTSFPKV